MYIYKMEKKETSGDTPGNTASGVSKTEKKREMQAIYWTFTFNNYTDGDMETLEMILKHECDWYVFQEETGEEGTPHLQGTIKLKRKKRLTELKKVHKTIHWEMTKQISSSIAYCTKEKTRTGKIFTYNVKIPEEVPVDEPYGWQLEIMKIIDSEPDKRTIHWFWEPKGGVGKTELSKYLCLKHNALMLTGKSADMFHMLSKHEDRRRNIICDIPRKNIDYINYAAIEMIKNGLVFSGKYDSCQLIFKCPHVIVFANQPPDETALSRDRWHIVEIDIEVHKITAYM